MTRRNTQSGFLLLEILAAMMLMTVGLLGIAGVYDGSRQLTSTSERTEVLVHRAQREIERVQAMGYDRVALSGVPERSTDPASPASLVTKDSPPALHPDRRDPNVTEALDVDPDRGSVSPAPTPWDDGRLRGKVYTYVSWHTDGHCGPGCPTARNDKRITVAVTVEGEGNGHPHAPVVVSTIRADPNAAPAGLVLDGDTNPLRDPATQCRNPDGALVPCTSSIGSDSATTWFLYDTPATHDVPEASTDDHPTHPTVATLTDVVCKLGVDLPDCRMPDLMGDVPASGDTAPPPADGSPPPLPDRSTDQAGSAGSGGRVLRRDVECDEKPSADNAKGEMWVTPKLPAARTMTGNGGMTVFTRTTTGVAAAVRLCVRFSAVPGKLLDLIDLPPVPLGTVSYALAAWPGVTTPVSFRFTLPGSGLKLALGERLGVRVWVAASSASDVVVSYDDPTVQSSLQINVR